MSVLAATASGLQVAGGICFGAVIGWNVYMINRYRTGELQLSDLVTLIAAIGGAAILALFPAKSDLFGAYGIGLAAGFFGYFVVLAAFVAKSDAYDANFFLDGRRRKVPEGWEIPASARGTVTPMGGGQQGQPR